MEVTRANFKQVLKLLKTAISSASFLAVDGEFTGLNTWSKDHPYDSPNERYFKLKQCCKDFLLIQFGLCTFQWNSKEQKHVAKPFNFYLFPSVANRNVPDTRFLCQSSSIDFLISHGFDFNKLFKEGIPYLRPFDEQKLRDSLEIKDSFSSPAFISPAVSKAVKTPAEVVIPPEHQEFIDQICNSVEDLVQSDKKSVDLPVCNGFQRKLIFQSIKKKFPKCDLHAESVSNESKQRYIVVTKVDEDEKERKLQEKQLKNQELLEYCIGFTEVVKLIAQSGKIIVGHNMFLDLIHTVHQFICPLPDSVEEFKSIVQSQFPHIIDTKTMASSQPFRDRIPTTRLDELVTYMEVSPFKKPNIVFDDEFTRYSSENSHYHEAGYDAYITGLAFISMSDFLGSLHKPPMSYVPPTSALIAPFQNKLHLMRMEDVPYLNLAGPDLSPSREHVFHLKFPSSWSYADILDLFSPFGYVYISWLNSTEAFVSLASRSNAPKVLRSLAGKSDLYYIMSYKQYQKYMNAEDEYDASQHLTHKRKFLSSSEESDAESDHEIKAPLEKKTKRNDTPSEEGELSDTSDEEQDVKVKVKDTEQTAGQIFEEPKDW